MLNVFYFDDIIILAIGGAVSNTMGPPLNLKSTEEAAAATINGGTDLEMGTTIWNSSMLSAVASGLVTEATVTTAARRNLMQRMVQGDFDPVVASMYNKDPTVASSSSQEGPANGADNAAAQNKTVAWSSIPTSVINSTEHVAIAYDAALQSIVLLKNAHNVLPLKVGVDIAVVGPGATTQKGLVGPYFGDALCYVPHEVRSDYSYACKCSLAVHFVYSSFYYYLKKKIPYGERGR